MRISVVIPCFNNGRFLAETLEGIRAQTLQPAEILLVDDASTDNSVELANAFPGVAVLQQPRNLGSGAARNRGLEAASGEVIAWLDADDIWEPHHLATVSSLLHAHPEVGVAFSLTRAFGARRYVWGAALPPNEPVDAFWPSWQQTVAQLSTCVMWRDRALEVGGFDPGLRCVQDFEFFLRLARRHPFVCTHEVTARYRKYAESASRKVVSCRLQEYLVRQRMMEEARRAGGDPGFAARLEAECLMAWEVRLREAWGQRDLPLLRFYLGLGIMIPGGESVVRHWWRRQKLAPLWGLWDRLHGRPARSPTRALEAS